MPSGWQDKLTRLSQMNWDEIRTRAAQEFHKRSDLVRHRVGRTPPDAPLRKSPFPRSEFFFAAGEAQQRAALLRSHLPSEALEILHEAEAIRHQHFHLLGYEDIDYGPKIDWHLDRVHGKRAPLDPWFKIPFLEFAVVGDHKVTWELNRHQHLVTLAKAWLLSSDEKYSHEVTSQWHSWIKANPYPLGINWGSSLEAAFRSLSWIWVDQLLAGAPGYAAFHQDLLPALAFHGRYIERYLSTYFSPNTHLLGEAAALFFIGTLYPELAPSSRWQHTGWNILLEQAQRQVRPDGVYFEQSLHYHVYALDFFLHARILAAKNGMHIPPDFDGILDRMLNVVQALSQSGPPEGFGDDDGGRVFSPRRNRTEHMTDPLSTGTVLYGRHDLSSAQLTEESIWLFGQSAISALASGHSPAPPVSAAFPDGGIYVLADASPFSQTILLDAGPQGIGHSGHGHADALSLRLTMNGERWLVDSGSHVYISAEPSDRNAFRGTDAHNTLRVDGLDQAKLDGPFSWTAIPNTRIDNWATGETFSYFAANHDGYMRLPDPVTHHRWVVKINGGPTLARDLALGRDEHELELRWHFGPELDVRPSGDNSWVASQYGMEGPSLSMIVPANTEWQTEIAQSLVSPAYGKLQKAPLARIHGRMRLPAETGTLMIPHASGVRCSGVLASNKQDAAQIYEWADQTTNHSFCFALDKRPWTCGPWSSDAEFLYCRITADKLVHLIMVGGTSVAWQEQELLKADGPSSFFEWCEQDGLPHAEPAPFSISPLFYELTGSAMRHAGAAHMPSSFAEKP